MPISSRSSRQSRTAPRFAARRSACSSLARLETHFPNAFSKLLPGVPYFCANASCSASVVPRSALHYLAALLLSLPVGSPARAVADTAKHAARPVTATSPLPILSSFVEYFTRCNARP